MEIAVNGRSLSVVLEDNSSAAALVELLKKGPVTVKMQDYAGMEKFGSLGVSLPANDSHITTQAGDMILSEGHLLVIYYAPNTWSFTRLGRIEGVPASELRQLLGKGSVTAVLSL